MAGTCSEHACSARAHVQEKGRLRWVMGGLFVAMIVGSWFEPWFGYFVPVCMVGGLAPAFFYGRKWCDWWCLRGSFLETAVGVITGGRPIPRLLRGTPFRVAIMAALFGAMGVLAVRVWGDWVALGGVFVAFLTASTVAAIALGMIFRPRAWCWFCPIGTLSQWAGAKGAPLHISADCEQCGLCAEICPAGVAPHEYREQGVVTDADCYKCGLCVAQCPHGALSFAQKRRRAA